MHDYHVFGLRIASEFPLPGLQETAFSVADVRMVSGVVPPVKGVEQMEDGLRFSVSGVGNFQVRGGHTITLQQAENAMPQLVSLYLLGSCMGAILYQRGGMLLHGSCVVKDGKGLLITGETGMGKSTMARAFLSRGWQLVTDDVAAIVVQDGIHFVQSSYPSQKLWQDAMARYQLSGRQLYRENEMEKFHVDVQNYFREGKVPLEGIVLLAIGPETMCHSIEGIARVDQLMKNTYRPYLIPQDRREQHFQRCVTLADEVPLYLGVRTRASDGTEQLCSKMEEEIL